MATYIKSGDRYFVDINHGKLLTIEEMEIRKKNILQKTIPEDQGFVYLIPDKILRHFDGIDENGYIHGWDLEKYHEIKKKYKNQSSKIVMDEHGFHEEPQQTKEAPKTGGTTDGRSGAQTADYFDFEKKTGYSESSQSHSDFDIPEWVNQGSQRRNNQTGKHYKGVIKMNNYRGMHEASRAAEYSEEQAQRFTQSARQTSVPPRKHAAARNRQHTEAVKTDFKEKWNKIWHSIVTKVIAVALGVALTATMTIGAERAIDNMITDRNISKSETYIASLLVPESAKNVPTLVERNTHRTEDFQGYWFDNNNIANEVLELPDQFFDAAVYLVYEEMGEDRYNAYINNFDLFISHIGAKAKAELNPTAFARCNGCSTFEEYLAKNGIASEEDFVKFMREKINQQAELIKQSALAHEFATIDPVTNQELEAQEAAEKSSDVTTGPALDEDTEEELNVEGGSRK